MSEQKRIALLMQQIRDQAELIETQREFIGQQQVKIAAQQAEISAMKIELKRRGKAKTKPAGPGLWMLKLVHKKPGRPRSDKEATFAMYEYMLAYKKAYGYKNMEDALVGHIGELFPAKNREDSRKIKAQAIRINNHFRRRNQLK